MEDINISLDDELELDYEGEEAIRVKPKENEDAISLEDEEDFDESAQDNIIPNNKTEEEFKKLSRKRRYSPPKWLKGEINEFDEVDPGRDLSAPKRFKFLPNLLPQNFFPDECDESNIPINVIDDHPELTNSGIENLFESLDVKMEDENIPLNTIMVWGTTDMAHYSIEKIFAEYHPHIALKLDNQNFIVQFKTSRIAAKMFIGMSKKLKRVRQPKNFEEGEIEDSDEEKEGEIKNDDNGEQVELVKEPMNETESDEIQLDITKIKIPKGKWRIITKHVPFGRTLLAKYAHITEIKKAMNNFDNVSYRQERVENQKSRNRLKPGINVFDSAGNELPWDFEHDTRIFNDPSLDVTDDKVAEQSKEQMIKIGDQEIRSRGRGTKKVFTLNFSSDEEDESTEEEDGSNKDEDDLNDNEKSKQELKQKPSDFFRTSILDKK